MDKALQNLSAIFSFAMPYNRSSLRRRHRTLAWLLASAGLVSVAVLLVAMLAASRSTRVFQDVNSSGSLRYRSLWIYGATQKNAQALPADGGGGWPAQVAAMRSIRERLSKNYPAEVAATDPAWNAFTASLTQTGQVDWRTANALRSAADRLTGRIAKKAAGQNAEATVLLRLGLGGLLCALAASCFLLSGLRAAEGETRQVVTGLQDSQDLFLRSINALQEGYLVQDRDGKTLFCNSAAERLLGVEASALIGREPLGPDRRCLCENREELPYALSPGILAMHDAQPQENVLLGLEQPSGVLVWLSVSAAPVFRAGETAPCAAVLTLTDKTAEKTIEEDLRKEKEFQSAMLESLDSGVVACDADGVLALFNRAAREFHGMPEAPLPAEEWADHFDLYEADGMTPLRTDEIPLVRAFGGEVVRDAEMVIAPKDGPARTVLASGRAIYSSSGAKIGAVAAMQDITARRRAEQELGRLAAIVASSEEAILAMTLDGTLVSWNSGAERLYGYTEAEIIGRHASLLVPEGTAGTVEMVIPQIRNGETVAPIEAVRRRRDGGLVTVGLTFSPIHDAAGQVIGASCIARDISARRQAEDALRESEARLRYLSDAAFEGIVVTQNGVVIDANPAFLALYGYETPDQIAGMAAELLAAPEVREIVRQKIASGDEDAYETRSLRRDGSTFSAEVRGRKVLWNGLPARVTAMRDMTAHKQMEDTLRESQRFAQSVAENSASFIYVYDLQAHKNVYANRNIMDLLGYTSEQLTALGENFLPKVIHPDDLPRMAAHLERFQTLEDGAVIELEYRAKKACGEYCWLWKREVVFKRHPDGTPWQVLSNAQDVTERKALENAFRQSEEAMRAVLSSVPVILYAADLDGTITLSEGNGLAALGLAPGEAIGRSVYEFTAQDPAMTANMHRALAGETVSYDMRYGALCLHVVLRPQRDPAGAVTGIIGISFDVTERAHSEERFRVLFEQSSNAHVLFDDGGIIDCNPAAVLLMRCTDKADLLGILPAALSPERQPDGRLSSEKGVEMCALARQNGTHRFEWTRRAADGTEIPLEVVLTEVMLNDKLVLLSVWHDLTERKRAEQQIQDYMVVLELHKLQLEESNRELEALATTDGLTGLKNHRTFQAKLAEEYTRAMRYHQPLSLLLLDVDHFKQFNDSFGHPAGDAVLQKVAETLQATARDTDVAARYGGEEFVVILPQTDEAGAVVIAERVRTAVAGCAWDKRSITVSLGVCTLSLDTPTPTSLIASADKALYCSKDAGRNRVTHGNPSAPPLAPPRASRIKRSAAAA